MNVCSSLIFECTLLKLFVYCTNIFSLSILYKITRVLSHTYTQNQAEHRLCYLTVNAICYSFNVEYIEKEVIL